MRAMGILLYYSMLGFDFVTISKMTTLKTTRGILISHCVLHGCQPVFRDFH